MSQTLWRSVARFSLLLLLAVSLCTSHGLAQQTLGSINGTVLDPSGAAVVGATVTATNLATNTPAAGKTQKTGYFEIFNLPIGTYSVRVVHEGFETTEFTSVTVQEARATTVNARLSIGKATESVEVTSNPLLNATDTTNGYTLDKEQIAATPLATGSFTQLAILAPGVSSQFIAGVGTNQGLGNQNVWANGQRSTSNTMTVNGVDVTNRFNGQTASEQTSQRYQFNIGEGSTTGGQSQDNIAVYGSNGNAMASPPPEFMQEISVTTSMYDVEKGQTSGAHIDINTSSGSNAIHGQAYGQRGTNFMNAIPFFYKQGVGLGTLPAFAEDPQLHKWVAGGTLGGPIKKDKLFFFLGFQQLYTTDQFGGLSQFQVPYGLTDDRSTAGITAACASYTTATVAGGGTAKNGACPASSTWNSSAIALLNQKLPNGHFLIPSPNANGQSELLNKEPDITLIGTSQFSGQQANGSLDYNLTPGDRMSAKYFYQHMPTVSPFSISNTEGFPENEDSGAQVFSLNNSLNLGQRINWEQRIGFSRQKSYSNFSPQLTASDEGITIPGGNSFPGIELADFGQDNSNSTTSKVGPESAFVDAGYFENRIAPSSNAIFSLGKHTISAGFNWSYDQLNIRNLDEGHAVMETQGFNKFLTGTLRSGTVLEGNSNRYYRSNDVGAYVMDKWQMLPNLSITAGIRYDFDGPLSEKNGDLFNFDPALYSATDSQVTNSGFVVAGNNKQFGTQGVSNSTLNGRQWGIGPRIGVAWAPKWNNNKVVWRTGFGLYYDRGEYFQYLSPPAGQGISGPFGVTEEAPFAAYTNENGPNMSNPFTTVNTPTTPATFGATLPTVDSIKSTCTAYNVYNDIGLSGFNCGAVPVVIGNYNVNNKLPYTEDWTLDFQWQPRSDTSVDIGYVGNRGRHAVIPLPFNEPVLCTPGNSTASCHGEQYSYGVQVLSTATNPNPGGAKKTPYAMANEPYNTFSGGNIDLRVPFVGYDPNSTSFTASGISAYDALQAHLEKRLRNGVQAGASYTWSHTLDEQSDVGLFFTGDNPNKLRNSYADADFDSTNNLTFNFLFQSPKLVKSSSNWLKYVANDWSLLGIVVLESGQPYSIYDFSGSVGGQYFGTNVELINPVLPLKPGVKPNQAKTGQSGAYTTGTPNGSGGVTANYAPALNADDFQIPLLAPGEQGVPACDTTTDGGNAGPGGGPLCDVYETGFVPGQRNIFRQSFQKRADITLQKDIRIQQGYGIRYQFEVFNVTNTPSFDVPTNNITLNPNFSELNGNGNGTQVQPEPGTVTTPNGTATCSGSSTACAYQLYTVPGAKSNKLGVVTGTIGSGRIVEMSLHILF
jgi:Carboxypeptidase regulatory-like domain